MLYHSIYSVRDKKKVNAEVIDIREIEGAKGVRFQIVGRHPEDGITVTTFCSAAVAEDYKEKMSTLPHGLSAESIEVAQDHIPTSEATVISTDGTPVDDDLETFVEDPLVGSPSEGTLTSAKVLAAEGELSKTSCCCGATEDKPCACMTSDEPMQCSSTEPKCACYAAKGAEWESKNPDPTFKGHESFTEGHIGITTNGDWAWSAGTDKLAVDIKLDPYQNYMFELVMDGGGEWLTQNEAQSLFEEIQNGKKAKQVVDEHIADFAGKNWRSELDSGNSEYGAETVAGIDIQTPSQIAIETPDSDELLVPDPDHLASGDGRVLGQQSGKVNTTPMHAEEAAEDFKVPVMVTLPAWNWLWCEGDISAWWRAMDSGESVKLDKDDFIELEYADDFDLSEVYFPYQEGDDGDNGSLDLEDIKFQIKVTDQKMLDSLIESYGKDIKSAETDVPETMSPKQALEYLKSGDNCVWLVGYSAGEQDYPIEEAEELATLIEEGVFEEDSTLVIATKLHKPWSGDAYNPSEDEDFGFGRNDAESYSPGLARNPKVLVPTAVIGGLALAYLAKPELLSGSLDKLSSILSSLTKKGDKTE